VYRALRTTFGKADDMPGEDRIQWLYVIEAPGSTIEVYDKKLYSWVLIVNPRSADDSESKRIARRDRALFLGWLQRKCRGFTTPKSGYSHLLVNNGYEELHSNGDYLVNYYKRVSKQVEAFESRIADKFVERGKTYKGWTRRVEGIVKSRFGFDGSAILWAAIASYVLSVEALLNLSYELYMKEDAIDDHDLAERIASYSVKEKWAMANLVCDCFRKRLPKTGLGYDSLQRLSSLRNNLAHANISRRLKTFVFEEDGIEFVIIPTRHTYSQMPTPSAVKLEDAESVHNDVENVAEELLRTMKPQARKEFSKLMGSSGILVSKTGKPVRSAWF